MLTPPLAAPPAAPKAPTWNADKPFNLEKAKSGEKFGFANSKLSVRVILWDRTYNMTGRDWPIVALVKKPSDPNELIYSFSETGVPVDKTIPKLVMLPMGIVGGQGVYPGDEMYTELPGGYWSKIKICSGNIIEGFENKFSWTDPTYKPVMFKGKEITKDSFLYYNPNAKSNKFRQWDLVSANGPSMRFGSTVYELLANPGYVGSYADYFSWEPEVYVFEGIPLQENLSLWWNQDKPEENKWVQVKLSNNRSIGPQFHSHFDCITKYGLDYNYTWDKPKVPTQMYQAVFSVSTGELLGIDTYTSPEECRDAYKYNRSYLRAIPTVIKNM